MFPLGALRTLGAPLARRSAALLCHVAAGPTRRFGSAAQSAFPVAGLLRQPTLRAHGPSSFALPLTLCQVRTVKLPKWKTHRFHKYKFKKIKIKTNKAAYKRIRRTSSGLFKRWQVGRQHLLSSKRRKRKNRLRKAVYLTKTQTKRYKRLCPYL